MNKKIKYMAVFSLMSNMCVANQPNTLNQQDIKIIGDFLRDQSGLQIGTIVDTTKYEPLNKLGYYTIKPVKEIYPFTRYEIGVTPISQQLYTIYMEGQSPNCQKDNVTFRSFIDKRFGHPVQTHFNPADESNMVFILQEPTAGTNNLLMYSCDTATNKTFIYYYREHLTNVFNNEVTAWYAKQLDDTTASK